jgi:hypothetical protein
MLQILLKNSGKKVLFAVVLSTLLHMTFFSTFTANKEKDKPHFIPGINIISIEQFEYLKNISKKTKDIISFILPKSITEKQPIWNDTIKTLDDSVITKTDISVEDKNWIPEESKIYNFREMQIPLFYNEYTIQDYFPSMDYLAQTETFEDFKQKINENIITLDNGIKIKYYIQGSVSLRSLSLSKGKRIKILIDKPEVDAKLRLWVTKDGRINQIIIEEGTSFSLVDAEIVKMVKSWHFSPLYDINAPNYEWGIISIKIQK